MIFISDTIGPRVAGLLCVLAGLTIAGSMPPWGWWPLAFVGIALLDRLLAGQPWKVRFLRGTIVGAAWMFSATVWMWDLTPPGYVIQGALFSVVYGLIAITVPADRGRRLALPAALTLAALIRWNLPYGGVPLATLAMSQADAPLGQTARIFGPLLTVFLVALVGVGLSAAASGHWRQAALAAGATLAMVGVAAVAPTGATVDTIDVAVVQGGGPQNTRAIYTKARDVFDRHMAASELIETPVDLVLWPEDVVHSRGSIQDAVEYQELAALAERVDAPVIAGIIESYRDDGYFLNASIVITPEGETVSRYDKVRRVPFGEYVPLRSVVEAFAPNFLPSVDARAGTGPAWIETDLGRFAVSISWEIFHDDRARDGVRDGGVLLLNPTNGSSYWLTVVQTQQIASSQLRAIETGRWVLQAAPTGFSAIIEPDGTIVERTNVSEARVIHGPVELREGNTWATQFGSWPMILVTLVFFAAARPPSLGSVSDLRSRATIPRRRR